ncbi:MAG: hypothetical protein KBT27_13280 [Prevotellaceae bacterium]|nr:hypothetical protein [Candidatus Faecinaster equi]
MSLYDGSYTTKEYEVGEFAGATIWIRFDYKISFFPEKNMAYFTFQTKAKASRASVLSHAYSINMTINGVTKNRSANDNIGTSYQYLSKSLMYVEGISPNSSGKFSTTVTFKYGTLSKTFSVTDIITIPQTLPTASATLSYDRSNKVVNANISYGNSIIDIFGAESYFLFQGEGIQKKMSLYSVDTGDVRQETFSWGESAVGNLQEGKSYKWELYVLSGNGKSRKLTGTLVVPATVNKVTIGSLSLKENSPVTKLPYTLVNNNKATNFAVTSVTYKGNNDAVATIDSQGRITVHSAGYVIFTVTSNDAIGGNPSASKYFYIASVSGFPFGDEEETTEWLSAPLTERIINACQMVATKQGITITGISQFSGYTTLVRNTKIVMERINDNVKKIADTKRIGYDTVALTFSNTNENGEWYEMVNEWLRLMPLFKPYS